MLHKESADQIYYKKQGVLSFCTEKIYTVNKD